MTEPDDSDSATRPISVAELLAKNGTIGAPPVTGRRRRRRGNSNAVTVAELTGEIPIVRTGEIPVAVEVESQIGEADADVDLTDADVDLTDADTEGSEKAVDEAAEEVVDEAVDEEEFVVSPELAPEPSPRRGRNGAPERSFFPWALRRRDRAARSAAAGAELMSPDPVDDAVAATDDALDAAEFAEIEVSDATIEVAGAGPDQLGLVGADYSGADDSALFGGDTLADEMVRAGTGDVSADADLERGFGTDAGRVSEGPEGPEATETYESPSRGRQLLRGLVTVAQSVLAVLFGAGLFVAFDQLWKWNSVVAMVLALLVTLGLVAGVWVVRKTEDIASTLIAVGVGLLVTFGPLALMHAG